MKRLAFVALMVALAACATDADVSDSAAGAMQPDSAQLRADSIRADSIRVDSLRKDSIAKGLIDTTAAR